jgi:hypothetical protein
VNVRDELHGINHPKLGDAERRVERGLAAEVVAEARVRDLDHEPRSLGGEAPDAARLRIEHEIGLKVGVRCEAERGFGGEHEIVRKPARPMYVQRGLQHLMLVTFRRHRDDLPPDQLDPLVFVENTGRRHRLQLGDGKPPPRQAFGRIRRHFARVAIHDA